jgi:hypothetical protein
LLGDNIVKFRGAGAGAGEENLTLKIQAEDSLYDADGVA